MLAKDKQELAAGPVHHVHKDNQLSTRFSMWDNYMEKNIQMVFELWPCIKSLY